MQQNTPEVDDLKNKDEFAIKEAPLKKSETKSSCTPTQPTTANPDASTSPTTTLSAVDVTTTKSELQNREITCVEKKDEEDDKMDTEDLDLPGLVKDAVGCNVRLYTPPSFDPETEPVEMKQYLMEHGYVVVSNVFKGESPNPNQAIQETKDLMWDYLETADGSFTLKRNDPSTWTNKNWIADRTNGIIAGYGFGHCDFMWRVRNLERVKKAFANIWNTDKLLVSFDGGNAFRPWKYEQSWVTNSGWWHIDQNSTKPHAIGVNTGGMACVQGLVTLTAVDEETGGFCVIPGSHKDHEGVCSRYKYPINNMGDFIPVRRGDQILNDGGLLLKAKAGDMILWDSRTVHCNTRALNYDAYIRDLKSYQPSASSSSSPSMSTSETEDVEVDLSDTRDGDNVNQDSNTDSLSSSLGSNNEEEDKNKENTEVPLLRQVAYVCMTPSAWASSAVLKKRKNAFIENTSTSHWPHEFYGGGIRGIDMTGAKPLDINSISTEQKSLIGVTDEFCSIS